MKQLPFPQKCEHRFAAAATERFSVPTPVERNKNVQGGCSDGEKYYYQVFMRRDNPSGQEHNEVRVAKIDMENDKVVQLSRNFWLHHANDITYNKKTHKLLVCNNAPHRNWLTVLDPDTLEMERTIELPVQIFGITYNEARDIYAAGISFGKSFCLLDADFHVIDDKIYPPTPLTDRYVNQGIGSDDDFIYFAFWDAYTLRETPADFQSTVAAYRWDGSFAGLIDFDIGPLEPENISAHKGKLLLVAGDAGTMRCFELS
jgi:hypothetical protein